MKPAIGGILIVTALVALVGLVIAAGSSMQGHAIKLVPNNVVRECAQACASTTHLSQQRCVSSFERCNLICRGESEDVGTQVVCQAGCTRDSQSCLYDALSDSAQCASAC